MLSALDKQASISFGGNGARLLCMKSDHKYATVPIAGPLSTPQLLVADRAHAAGYVLDFTLKNSMYAWGVGQMMMMMKSVYIPHDKLPYIGAKCGPDKTGKNQRD